MYDDEGYEYFDDELDDRIDFADPGGGSALRAATKDNPRNLPCPTCGWPNRLTPADRALGYQCDSCADAQEQGRDIDYYDGESEDEEDEVTPLSETPVYQRIIASLKQLDLLVRDDPPLFAADFLHDTADHLGELVRKVEEGEI